MYTLVSALRVVPIYLLGGGIDAPGTVANPNYGVTISDSKAREAAKAATLERERARLFLPRKPSNT
ncbi:uncharacterized protein RCC_03433 [Ramularia collo-cygni]|uniref:Uncharacterized protein n=1 Tax=Ramularia collo-cygni TaxID=112498 RepID=A0A2D3V7Y4_9PEZI|nr:uncharacterized protein RCC_03433 [Ramularia collo-cygni]CZT17599.1 uncharacterized protein RCC_03433 [Ramularia collo-cygni]